MTGLLPGSLDAYGVLQLSQIPMIAVGRLPAIKRNKLAGNIVFWAGLFVGLPLLCVAYVAY